MKWPGKTSMVERCVFKRVTKFREYAVIEREIGWLKLFGRENPFPFFLGSEPDGIVMTWCGERLTDENMPADWMQQATTILRWLHFYNCRHNDIKPNDLLVLDDKIHLVDFGWALKRDEPIPTSWPPALGGKHRGMTDEEALFASLEEIMTCRRRSAKK